MLLSKLIYKNELYLIGFKTNKCLWKILKNIVETKNIYILETNSNIFQVHIT